MILRKDDGILVTTSGINPLSSVTKIFQKHVLSRLVKFSSEYHCQFQDVEQTTISSVSILFNLL